MRETGVEDPSSPDPELTATADTLTKATQPISLFRGTSVVAALTLVSRLLGFFRDALVARLFGASVYADAFFVAFRIPNLLRSLVAEGALTSAFVPVFNDELKRSKHAANSALVGIGLVLSGICTLLTVLGILFATDLITLFAPGFTHDAAQLGLAAGMLKIMLPLILFVALVALINGALNSVGIFGSGAWAQIVMNLCLIVGAIVAAFYTVSTAAYIFSFSVLIGAVVQVLVQIPALRRAGFSVGLRRFTWAPVKAVFRLLPPAILGATVYQLQIFIVTVMASLCGAGAVSWMFYADRIVQLPVGVYTIALSSVLLAVLSKARAEADSVTFSRELNKALSLSVFLLMPLSAGLVLFAQPLVSLVFVRGAFTQADAMHTATIVGVSSLALLPVSLHSIFSRVFIAHKDTVTTTLVGILTLLLTLLLALCLVGEISAGTTGVTRVLSSIQLLLPRLATLGVLGLTWASVTASTVSCLTLACLLVIRFKVSFRPLLAPLGRSIVATSGFVLVSLAIRHYIPDGGLLVHAVSAAIGVLFWISIHTVQRGPEVGLVSQSLRKLKRK